MVETMCSQLPNDPDEVHHPERGCPERVRIKREGNAIPADAEVLPIFRNSPDKFQEVVSLFDDEGNMRTLKWCDSCVGIVRARERD